MYTVIQNNLCGECQIGLGKSCIYLLLNVSSEYFLQVSPLPFISKHESIFDIHNHLTMEHVHNAQNELGQF